MTPREVEELSRKLSVLHNRLHDIDCETGLLCNEVNEQRAAGGDGAALQPRLKQLARLCYVFETQGNAIVQSLGAGGAA